MKVITQEPHCVSAAYCVSSPLLMSPAELQTRSDTPELTCAESGATIRCAHVRSQNQRGLLVFLSSQMRSSSPFWDYATLKGF